MLEGETQVSTVWLQCVLLFSMIWGLASTLVADSRKLFDTFLRKLVLGNDDDYPKPKAFKLTKQQLFPDRGTVFDWVYDKRNNGSWISWIDTGIQVNYLVNKLNFILRVWIRLAARKVNDFREFFQGLFQLLEIK